MTSTQVKDLINQLRGNTQALQDSKEFFAVGVHTDKTQFYWYPKNSIDLQNIVDILIKEMPQDADQWETELKTIIASEQAEIAARAQVEQDQQNAEEDSKYQALVQEEYLKLKATRDAQALLDAETKK